MDVKRYFIIEIYIFFLPPFFFLWTHSWSSCLSLPSAGIRLVLPCLAETYVFLIFSEIEVSFHLVFHFFFFSSFLPSFSFFPCKNMWLQHHCSFFPFSSSFFFFLAVLGLELRAYTLSHSTSPFLVMGFFEIGSHELFAWAGFEPQSSWSLPPE
jgi:hypothetical protein